MSCNKDLKSITYDEKVKGWTSFHSFLPDWIIGLNNDFFTFKDGNLYKHHSDNVPRNSYYGVVYPSKLSVMVNESPSEIKEIQAVALEGNHSWNTLIKAYISNIDDFDESSIKSVEFVKKEGIWYAYARRNEDSKHVDSKSTYGIGRVAKIYSNTITVNGYNDLLTIGDEIADDNLNIIGKITNISNSGNLVLTLTTTNGLSINSFLVGMKPARIEGGNLRGYTMRMDLDVTSGDKVELFAVNTDVIKSYT